MFDDQDQVGAAFKAGELDRDGVVVVRFQGPRANGMPELHSLTPPLGVLQKRGFNVALVTDGRMSGASGSVPAAIHLTPELCPAARSREYATATRFASIALRERFMPSCPRKRGDGASPHVQTSRRTATASAASCSRRSEAPRSTRKRAHRRAWRHEPPRPHADLACDSRAHGHASRARGAACAGARARRHPSARGHAAHRVRARRDHRDARDGAERRRRRRYVDSRRRLRGRPARGRSVRGDAGPHARPDVRRRPRRGAAPARRDDADRADRRARGRLPRV